MRIMSLLIGSSLLLFGACAEAPETDAPVGQDPSSEAMREEVMEEQFEEVTVLQREMTGDWRAEAREMLLDFEDRRFEGYTPAGARLEGDLRVVEEGADYVVFMIGDETLTARAVGDGELMLSTGPDDVDGLRFRR